MVLHYAKGCRFEDCPVSFPDFGKMCASGELKYKQMPVLTGPDGKTKMTQSNSIVRYIGKKYCGLKGECLYPCNS